MNSIKRFLELKNACEYYEILFIKLSGFQVMEEYREIMFILKTLSLDIIKDFFKILKICKNKKYKILFGNLVNYWIKINRFDIVKGELVKFESTIHKNIGKELLLNYFKF